MARLIDLNKYKFNGKEKIILDTNVLLYLFGPFNGGNDYGYSEFLKNAINSCAELFVNNQILSEFINRNCRLAYQQYLKNKKCKQNKFQYKRHYRSTADFKENYKLSIEIIKTEILSISNLSVIDVKDITHALSHYQMLDFNDELILQNAYRESLNIVTHDTDFFNVNIEVPIMTYNV